MKFYFEVQCRLGSGHQAQEVLSRFFTTGLDDYTLEDEIPALPLCNGSTRTTFDNVSGVIGPHPELYIPSSDYSHVLLSDYSDLHYPISQDELIRSETSGPQSQTFATLIDTPG